MLSLLFDANFWYMMLVLAAVVGLILICVKYEQARVFVYGIFGIAFVVLTGYCGIELNSYYTAQGGVFGFIGEQLHPNQLEVLTDYTYSIKYLMLTQDSDGGYSATIYANDVVKLEEDKEYGVYVNGTPATQVQQESDYLLANYRYQFYDDDAITLLCDDTMTINFAFYEKSTTIKLSIVGGTNTFDGQSTVNYWNNYFSKNNFIIEVKELGYSADAGLSVGQGDTSNFNVVNYYLDGSHYDTIVYQAGQSFELPEVSVEGKSVTDWTFVGGDFYAYTYVPFDYEVDGSSLVSYNGSETNVTVPKTYSLLSGKYATYGEEIAITRIEKGCFDSSIQTLTIQDNITSIAGGTFDECVILSKVYIESKALYDILTSKLACGGLLEQTQGVYILADIDDKSNAYLSNSERFTITQSEKEGKIYNLYSLPSVEIEVTDEEFATYQTDLTPASGGAITEVLNCKFYESTGKVELLAKGINSRGSEVLIYQSFSTNATETTFTALMENKSDSVHMSQIFAASYISNGAEVGEISTENVIATYNNSDAILLVASSVVYGEETCDISVNGLAVMKNTEGNVAEFYYMTATATTTESELEDVEVQLAHEMYNRAFD